MRKYFVYAFMFTCTILFGQAEQVLQASLLFDSASTLAAQQQPKAALQAYQQAFKLDPWSFYDYLDAFSIALEVGDTVQANGLLSAGVRHGLNLYVFTDMPQLQGFLGSSSSRPFRELRTENEQAFGAIADSAFIRTLDSLVTEDQRYRSSTANIEPMNRTDSLNFEYLIQYFGKHGFPDPHTIGHGIGDLHLLLWHHRGMEYPGSAQWKRVLPYFRKAMEDGTLKPSFLVMFDDFADCTAGRPMRYGSLIGYYRDVPEKLYFTDREQLNRNRASVGLGPIEDAAIVFGMDQGCLRFAEPWGN